LTQDNQTQRTQQRDVQSRKDEDDQVAFHGSLRWDHKILENNGFSSIFEDSNSKAGLISALDGLAGMFMTGLEKDDGFFPA